MKLLGAMTTGLSQRPIGGSGNDGLQFGCIFSCFDGLSWLEVDITSQPSPTDIDRRRVAPIGPTEERAHTPKMERAP